jgi:hypothetical protein
VLPQFKTVFSVNKNFCFGQWIRGFQDLPTKKPSSVFMLLGCSLNCIDSHVSQSLQLHVAVIRSCSTLLRKCQFVFFRLLKGKTLQHIKMGRRLKTNDLVSKIARCESADLVWCTRWVVQLHEFKQHTSSCYNIFRDTEVCMG